MTGSSLSHLFVHVRVAFEAAPADQEWGMRHAWLRDPSGYRLSICSPNTGSDAPG